MTWNLVQKKIAKNDNGSGPQTFVAVTLDAPVTSGNMVIMAVNFNDQVGGPITLATFGDTLGTNTYNQETAIAVTADGDSFVVGSLGNITNGPQTFGASFSTAAYSGIVVVEEWSWSGGATDADPRDGTAHGGQYNPSSGFSANDITSGLFTTVTTGDLIWSIGFNSNDTAAWTVGTGFASNANTDATLGTWISTESLTQSTPGSIAGTWSHAGEVRGAVAMLAMKPPAGGGGGSFSTFGFRM